MIQTHLDLEIDLKPCLAVYQQGLPQICTNVMGF